MIDTTPETDDTDRREFRNHLLRVEGFTPEQAQEIIDILLNGKTDTLL